MRETLFLIVLLTSCSSPKINAPKPTFTSILPRRTIITDTLDQIPKNLCNFDREKPIKVAILDTGLNLTDKRFKGHICSNESKDFTGEGISDNMGHGTHVAGLIKMYAGNGNYCITIYKIFSRNLKDHLVSEREVKALNEANKHKMNLINLSGGGNAIYPPEYKAIKNNPYSILITAAGNNGENTDLPENKYYPASYNLPNIISVENFTRYKSLSKTSNYSKKSVVEIGDHVYSYLPGEDNGGYMSGTSQATAIRTGKLLHYMLNSCTQEKK